MLHIISVVWLAVSFATSTVTWIQMRISLRQSGVNLHTWDQWANFHRFRKLVAEEDIPVRKTRYASLFRTHVWATISTVSGIALFVWTLVPCNTHYFVLCY